MGPPSGMVPKFLCRRAGPSRRRLLPGDELRAFAGRLNAQGFQCTEIAFHIGAGAVLNDGDLVACGITLLSLALPMDLTLRQQVWLDAPHARAQVFLKCGQVEGIVLRDEADRSAGGAGATGTAYTVHVVFRVIRQLIVDHMGNAVDMNARPATSVAIKYFSSPA